MIIFNRSIEDTVSVSVLDGTNPKYVYIPAIYYDGVNDNSVTSIATNGFSGVTNLESIIIPESVISIGDGALSGCTSLAEIVIPDSVSSIGNGAFSGSTSLATIVIPDSVTTIGNSLFAGCSNLSSVTIPPTIGSIGENAFSGCSSLTTLTIPESVTSIGAGAFSGSSSLTAIVIPDSVTSIGSNVFSDCPNLTDITISPGNSAFTTDGKAFYDSSYTILQKYYANVDTSYNIPSTVLRTDNYSFQNANALTSMTIPSTITSIGEYMFNSCSGLESVSFFTGSTYVSVGMFASCSNLISVSLPSSVTSIGNYGFSQCNSLTTINFTNIQTIGSYAFLDCSNLSSISFGNQLTSIGSHSFDSCTSISSLSIPTSVTNIGAYAFNNCSSIPMVLFNGNYPTIGENAFSGLDSQAVIYFNPEKTGWTNFATINDISTIALVYISGTFTQQQTLTANIRFVEAGIVPNGTTFSYQWYEDSSPISGANTNTLVLMYEQVSKTIHVVVSYNIGGSLTTLTSISSSTVDAYNNLPTGSVSISGSNTPSSVLTATNTLADVDGLGTFYYQWYRNTISSNVGGSAITDASNTTYTLSGIDANAYIYVKLYYTDNYGTPEIVYSSPTVQIVGLPPSDVSATATSETTALVSFTPSDNVTSYTVTSSPGGITNTGTSSPIIISGLTANTAYTFTVTSSYGSYTTPSSEPSTSIDTFRPPSSYISASSYGDESSTITFETIVDVASYEVYAYVSGSDSIYSTTTGSTSPITVSGLSAVTSYYFKVASVYGDYTTSSSIASNTVEIYSSSGLTISSNSITGFTGSQSNVLIPSNVTSIGTSAFVNETDIQKVYIGSGLTSIGTSAFSGCSGLRSITLPNNVTTLGASAFSSCSGLTSVSIGSGVAAISVGSSTHSFVGCSAVTNFTVDASNTTYSTDGYALLNKAGTQLYHYITRASSTSYTIGNLITSMSQYSFYNCTELTSVSIGTGLTNLNSSSFSGCSGLLSISIPNNIRSIGEFALSNCSGLTSLSIGSGVVTIYLGTISPSFYNCSSLTNFTVDASNATYSTDGYSLLNKAGTTLWQYITQGIASYTVSNTILSIYTYAFLNCTGLTSISIGSGVTSIVSASSSHSFYGCSALSNFTVDASNTTYSTDGYSLLNKAGTSLRQYLTRAITSYTIGNTITRIESSAFYNCTELTSLSIGSGVTSISVANPSNSFVGCSALSNFTVDAFNTAYSTDGYSLLNISGITLFNYMTQANASYTMSNTITNISAFSFEKCSILTSVSIGSGVTSIGTNAFSSCVGLLSITIPNSVTTLGNNALRYCSGLTSLILGTAITTIGGSCINSCTGLTTITIPLSVTFIGPSGINSNSNLARIIFDGNYPSTITTSNSLASNKTGCILYYYPNKTGWPGTAITGVTTTSLLAVTGTKTNGETLTATQYLSTIGATGLTYQWYSNVSNSNIGGSAISAATSSTYVYDSTYEYVYVTVSYTLDGSSTSLTSNAF